MKTKHKLIQDFQFISGDKKIFILKTGIILEEYIYKLKGEEIPVDREIVDANPLFFQLIDWQTELLLHIKSQKLPTPAVLAKKIIPFIEDMILSSISQSSAPIIDEDKIKELERKESDLNNRERRIIDKENEVEIRLNRVDKREVGYKEELIALDKKEDDLRFKYKELVERSLDIDNKLQDFNEKERNFDRSVLESSDQTDTKYKELQNKIDDDLKKLSEGEKDLENNIKKFNSRVSDIDQKESDIDDKIRNFNITLDETKLWERELVKLNSEIKTWESMHWKLQRHQKPPSAL